MYRWAYLLPFVCALMFCGLDFWQMNQPEEDKTVPDASRRYGVPSGVGPISVAKPRLVVRKAVRRLDLYDRENRIRTYSIALGREPKGDKAVEGDGRTPEGVFYICTKNRQSRYTLSMGISYPNQEDADRGLRDGLIHASEHAAIMKAMSEKRCPPWKSRLGGEICIHGCGTHADWTAGCIALSDENIRELFALIPMGTEIEIRP